MSSDGYAIGHFDEMGDGPGFRKVRRELDIKELGVNVLVIPPGFEARPHKHEKQEEVYFVHSGVLELRFSSDGSSHRLEPGGIARVDAETPRQITNPGDEDLVLFIVGAHGGYVGRDGVLAD